MYSAISLHTNNEISETECKKTTPFKTTSKQQNKILMNKPHQEGERLIY